MGGRGGDQRPFGLTSAEGTASDTSDGDLSRRDDLVLDRHGGADPGQRQVAGGLLELLVGGTRRGARRQRDGGDDLVVGQIGGEDALEEVVERSDARRASCCYRDLGPERQ